MRYTLLFLSLMVMAVVFAPLQGQTLSLFSVNQSASSRIGYSAGTTTTFASDVWSGSYDLGATGITSGSSSLLNPGLGSSGSGSLFADHTFNALSWDLSGSAQATINAGLGNVGSSFPTIGQTTILGSGLSFFIDSPFTLSLAASLTDSFTGSGSVNELDNDNQAIVRLFAQVIDGVLVNQYLASWESDFSAGGTYSGSFNSGVFRLETYAGADLGSNIPNAFGTQFSSYDLQMSVQPIPEPSGMLLIGVGAGFLCLRRRRRAAEN